MIGEDLSWRRVKKTWIGRETNLENTIAPAITTRLINETINISLICICGLLKTIIAIANIGIASGTNRSTRISGFRRVM